jgi:hypothetical protein
VNDKKGYQEKILTARGKESIDMLVGYQLDG